MRAPGGGLWTCVEKTARPFLQVVETPWTAGTGAGGDEVGGRALEDDPAAVVTGTGPEVDDPVGMGHDRLMVLDDENRLAGVDEPVEQAEQLLDVGEVQAARRLVEDVDAR